MPALDALDVWKDVNALARNANRIREWVHGTRHFPEAPGSSDPQRVLQSSPTVTKNLGCGQYVLLLLQKTCPCASFAGQQETFLNIRGRGQCEIRAAKEVFASSSTYRAIALTRVPSRGFDAATWSPSLLACKRNGWRSENRYCRRDVHLDTEIRLS